MQGEATCNRRQHNKISKITHIKFVMGTIKVCDNGCPAKTCTLVGKKVPSKSSPSKNNFGTLSTEISLDRHDVVHFFSL